MRSFVVVLVLLLAPGLAEATTALRLEPRDLAARSRAIVEGRVISTASERTPDGKRIFTRVRIRVDEVWKGTPDREVEVVLPGGAVGDFEQIVQGMPRFGEDERVLVFLEDAPAWAAYRVVGLAQGKFTVVEVAEEGKFAVPNLEGLLLVDPKSRAPVEPAIGGPTPLHRLRRQVLAPEVE
jgi:hypothetical protein